MGLLITTVKGVVEATAPLQFMGEEIAVAGCNDERSG